MEAAANLVMDVNLLPERIAAKITVHACGCWEWNGYRNRSGYGTVKYQKKTYLTHRLVYRLLVGPIPEFTVLDHLLADREVNPGPCVLGAACCNPAHVDPVTVKMNGAAVRNWHRAKTHCPQGHEYAVHGEVYSCADGGTRRFCGACRKERDRSPRKRGEVSRDAVIAVTVPMFGFAD